MENKSAYEQILAKKTTVTVDGVSILLSRPSGDSVSNLYDLAGKVSDKSKNNETPVAELANLNIGCIAACLPDLCADGDTTAAIELYAASGGFTGELSLTAAKLCGFDEIAIKEAFEAGVQGENSEDLKQPTG